MAFTQSYADYATGNDYKGASFTDGAYTSATKTLVKTNAFTANKVNHWLALSSNSGGSIVTGYYKIATWTDASTVILATDAGAGVNATDVKCTQAAGTTSLPWRSVQGALDLITRDATNGDQINVKAGSTDTLSSALVLTTYGTATATAPLFIRGYTSAANDGGIGVIEGGGAVGVISATGANYMWFVDMKLGNTGSVRVARLGTGSGYWNCEIYNSSAAGIQTGANNTVFGCYIHDCATGIDGSAAGGHIMFCHFFNGATRDFTTAIDAQVGNTVVSNNILNLDGTSIGIKVTTGVNVAVKNNSIFSAAGTGTGIYVASGVAQVFNNIVEGFSGSGGIGIRINSGAVVAMMAGNAVYNSATNISNAGLIYFQGAADDTLSGSAFVNASSGDFDINGTVTGVTEDGWPATFLGASSTTPKDDKGASQAGAGAGGGGAVRILPLIGGIG